MVHMDIKSANVLLQDNTCQVAKIADLGVSRYLVEGSLVNFTLRGAYYLFDAHMLMRLLL